MTAGHRSNEFYLREFQHGDTIHNCSPRHQIDTRQTRETVTENQQKN